MSVNLSYLYGDKVLNNGNTTKGGRAGLGGFRDDGLFWMSLPDQAGINILTCLVIFACFMVGHRLSN